MELSAYAAGLLAAIDESQRALVTRSAADQPIQEGLRAVSEALSAGLSGLTDAQIGAVPEIDQWSMAEIAEHVAEHDRRFIELERHGAIHYVEHGLEHALQLWRLRARLLVTGDDGANG